MKRHTFLIIGGFCYLIIFLIVDLFFIDNAYWKDASGRVSILRKPNILVIGIILISQSLIVFVTAVFYALKTRIKNIG